MDANSSDRDGENPPEGGDSGGGAGGTGEPRVKRKMKTPAQLEVLERTYKVETYPPEALRAELSAQLGLSDRQLQMWFCHRRLKDRKTTTTTTTNNSNNNNSTPPSSSSKRARRDEALASTSAPPPLPPPPSTSAALVADDLGNEFGSVSGSGSSPLGRRGGVPRTGVAVPRISRGRYYEPPSQPLAEVRAIAYIEGQLGEPLREDGPAFGIEFDPLPPGAFGTPIGAPQKHPGRVFEPNLYDSPDVKAIKGPGRTVHQYQFLPEQPSIHNDAYERLAQPHYYGSPPEGLSARTHALSAGRSSMHGGEEVPSYGLQGQVPSLSLMSHQGKHPHHMPSTSGEFVGMSRRTPYKSMPVETPFGSHPTAGLDVGLVPPESSMHDEDVVRLERKRKGEEVRVQKENEVHEKRMKKELEKQDLLRRKREEQMRKDMERQDRERKKEEERMLRERQREVERCQREQRREMERKEKFLQKESIRVERLKQKEELRKEKEAARQKAANDRAAARRIAKESTELIEDERLEFMEIAASRKGLPSILSLDSETLQNLDSCREFLCEFPPKTVQLKRPFSVQPWTDSEENVGKLLMLWRFFITFADVFGLWPFTLDEFVQAFHDYDPRLLGEIHIALLRTVIKDIEDVARTPTGMGANQSNAVNHGGGHPHIVEGAYAWGFDIRSWQQHLSPLTWPEILRQFALSAGFGPKLKKRNIEPVYMCDDNEGNDGKSIISNLRNGAAAVNAVAIMKERGYSNPRKSRHRLTPGTVKFAAFHVLSLEGSRGLNILDVADRIQKSGLRDLTTSKTPEASIAAALSRDTKLFERVAPSTYCLRTPYRKDPADAESILSGAREKIRVFKSGVVDEVEVDDVEKEDDSESDTTEDPEIDDLGAESVTKTSVKPSHEVKRPEADVSMENGKEPLYDGVDKEGLQNGLGSTGDADVSINQSNSHVDQNEPCNTDQEENDIDESSTCEPWVQGLVDGDYSDISVEERLNALVALISVAIEGNSVRTVLEERLEAATSLKKQMWAEAQLDKRRLKEEQMKYTTSAVNRAESNINGMGENQSPLLAHEQRGNDPDQDRKSPLEKNLMNADSFLGPDNMALQQSTYAAAERSRAQFKSYIGYKAEQIYVYRSLPLGMDRRRNRYWQFIASASCNDPGSGRIFVELNNGGWRLIDSEEDFDALLSSLDVRGVRESHLYALLQRIETLFKESFKRKQLVIVKPEEGAVKTDLSAVASHLDSCENSPNSIIYTSNSKVPETSSSFQIESGRNDIELKNILQRYKDFEEWIWKEYSFSSSLRAMKYGEKRCEQLLGVCDCCHDLFFFEDHHCPTCHNTFPATDLNINFPDHMARCDEMLKFNPVWKIKGLDSLAPVRIRLLKGLLAHLEVSVPTDALQPYWSDGYRRSWGMQLYMSSSADDLLQAVTTLEGAIKKDFLSPKYQTTNELLASSNSLKLKHAPFLTLRDVPVLPWIPQTTAAVALRLMELDSAISYTSHQKEEFKKEAEARDELSYIQSKFIISGKTQGNEPGSQWVDPSSGGLGFSRSKSGRGRGIRSASSRGRSQRRLPGGSRPSASASTSQKPVPIVTGWKNRSARGRGGRKRSRKPVSAKQKTVKKVGPALAIVEEEDDIREEVNFSKSPLTEEDEDWIRDEEVVQMQVETGEGNDNSEYEDEDMAEDDGYVGGYGVNVDVGEDDEVEEEDDDEEEEDVNRYVLKGYQRADEGAEFDRVQDFLNGDSEEEEDDRVIGNRNLGQDDGTASTSSSSEYSD
ncbi:hypothetical protein V2J09_020901 [Rumex salicifolius]